MEKLNKRLMFTFVLPLLDISNSSKDTLEACYLRTNT